MVCCGDRWTDRVIGLGTVTFIAYYKAPDVMDGLIDFIKDRNAVICALVLLTAMACIVL